MCLLLCFFIFTPTLHPVFGLRTYFFPVVKLSPKEELLKTDLQKEMNRHLKVFCTAIAVKLIVVHVFIHVVFCICFVPLPLFPNLFNIFLVFFDRFSVSGLIIHTTCSILCISQLHPPAAYIAGLVLFRFYGPMFCCLFVLGSFL